MKSLIFFAVLLILPAAAWAGCDALKKEESYSGPYKSMKFLIEGKEGWIFRSRQDMRQSFSVDEEAWILLTDVQEEFKKRKTDLAIIYPPTRGIAAAAMIPQDVEYDYSLARQSYQDFLQEAAHKGIIIAGTPDVRSGINYFYKADHHWTTQGAREMAESTADLIKNIPVYKDLRRTPYKTDMIEQQTLKSVFSAPYNALCGKSLEDLTDYVYATRQENEASDEASLFSDNIVPEIVLAGTSNSRRDRLDMNFEGFLKEYLSADILNVSIAGAGIEDPLSAYLGSDHFKQGKARIIIWEIPGYYNLSSDRSKDMLRGISASLKGDCKKPILQSKNNIIDVQSVPVFQISGEKIKPDDVYLVFEFSRPINIGGFLTMRMGDHEYETYKFRRSKKYPQSALYFYRPEYKGGEFLQDVSIKFPKTEKDLTFDARICRYE